MGTCTIVGVSPETARITLNPNVFTMMEKAAGRVRFTARPGCASTDAAAGIDPYMDKKIKIDELVSRTFPLEGVNEALRSAAKAARPRAA